MTYIYNDSNYPPAPRILIQVKDRRRPKGNVVQFNVHKKLPLSNVMGKYASHICVRTSELQFMALDKSKRSKSGASELQSIGPDDTAETHGIEHGDVISAMRASGTHSARSDVPTAPCTRTDYPWFFHL